MAPSSTPDPIYLRKGSVIESAVDLQASGPGLSWVQSRSYDSSEILTGDTQLGNNWLSNNGDTLLVQKPNQGVSYLLNASAQQLFSYASEDENYVQYTAPHDSAFSLVRYKSSHEYRLTNRASGQVSIFFDFSNASTPGKLKEQTNRDWLAQGKTGIQFPYASGKLASITTAQGQQYYLGFTYTGSGSSRKLTQIQLKTSVNGTLLGQVDYTYYTGSPQSADLGSDGDLVQVKTQQVDSSGSNWIVRYTQYRYYRSGDANGAAHLLKAVFESSAVQRILDVRTDITSHNADDILAKADGDDNGGPKIQDFATRRFTYYTTNLDTSQAVTTVFDSEHLQSTYGGIDVDEAAGGTYMAKSELVGGCGNCGSAGGVSHNYYYLNVSHPSPAPNDVVRLVIEDTVDGNGNGAYRKIYGLSDTGQKLREATIAAPTGTPQFWCESWKLSTSTTTLLNRLVEHRTAAAHNVTISTIDNFLDPTTGSNDGDTLNGSAGLIEVYEYDSNGYQTAQKVKEGSGGTANYVWSNALLGGSNLNRQALVADVYAYPQQTSTLGDSSASHTQYAYDFWTNTDTVKTVTVTQPSVPTTQNGSGTSTVETHYFDNVGRLRWKQDGEGYITYYSYDPKSGKLAYTVNDANPSSLPSSADGNSTNWVTSSDSSASSNRPTRDGSLPAARQQVNKLEFDSLGRQVIATVEDGQTGTDLSKNYTVYEANRTLQFPFWQTSNSQPLQPIQATVVDAGETITDTYAVDPSCAASSGGVPTGLSSSTTQSDYRSWTHNNYDPVSGQRISIDRYHNIPSSGPGTLSTNFYRMAMLYDAMGRRGAMIQVVSGTDPASSTVDQVSVWIFDAVGRLVKVKKGVSGSSDGIPTSYSALANEQSPPSWLKTVSQAEYDGGNAGGNSLVTRTVNYYGTGSTDNTGRQIYYTFRGHARAVRPFKAYDGSSDISVGPYVIYNVNWMGRITATAIYTSAPTWPTDYSAYADTTAANRGKLSETHYDALGRTYCSERYTISSVDGSKGNKTQANFYYDRRGNQVAFAPKHEAATETAYDGLGRAYETRNVLLLKGDDGGSFYSSGAFQYRSPTPNPAFSSSSTGSMSGGDDKVMAMSHQVFDAADNVIETHSFATIDADTNGLNLSTNSDYIRSSTYQWYDIANRVTAQADYGCGSISSNVWQYAAMPSRPTSAPSTSATVLVSQYGYDSATGRLQLATNPKGQQTKIFYDYLGRATYVAGNYDNFSPPSTGTGDATDHSKDEVMSITYNGLGRQTKYVALDQNGDGTTNNEVTTYLYEDPYNASLITSAIYPDSSDTDSSGTNQLKVQYNLDGSRSQKTDQRGTVIQYTYNDRRKLQIEGVTTLGGSTDSYVQSIKRDYDSLGRLTTLTSYSNSDGTGTVRNQVVQSFTDYGPVSTDWQSHTGTAVTSGGSQSPNVQYGFDTTADGNGVYQNGPRLQQVTYPNGRVIYYQYGSSAGDLDDLLRRITHIRQTNSSGQLLAQYHRLGSDQIIQTDYAEPQLRYTLLPGGTAGVYDGMDQFGRVKDLLWRNYGASIDAAHIQHGYDYAGNRIWRADPVAASNSVNLDEYYTYDGLNRLIDLQRGQLNQGKTGISNTPAWEEAWTLDALGNWLGYVQNVSGSTNLSQTRTHDLANKITQINSSTTHIASDLAGSMTKLSKPGNWNDHYCTVYDAWNRLVEVLASDGSTIIAQYQYDGRNFRTVKKTYTSGSLSETRHFYYNGNWQRLEERLETSGVVSSYANRQNVWGVGYVDDLILRDRDADGNSGTGNLGATGSGLEERLYAMRDPNSNVVAVADTTGAVQERYGYSAYGTPTFLTSAFAARNPNTSSYAWDTLYTGRQYDPETGLYHYRNRPYDAGLGRFSARDPLEYQANCANLYEYVYDSPTSFTDPLGLQLAPNGGDFWPRPKVICTAAQCAADKKKYDAEAKKIDEEFNGKGGLVDQAATKEKQALDGLQAALKLAEDGCMALTPGNRCAQEQCKTLAQMAEGKAEDVVRAGYLAILNGLMWAQMAAESFNETQNPCHDAKPGTVIY